MTNAVYGCINFSRIRKRKINFLHNKIVFLISILRFKNIFKTGIKRKYFVKIVYNIYIWKFRSSVLFDSYRFRKFVHSFILFYFFSKSIVNITLKFYFIIF